MTYNFCTLFDKNYAYRGLAMYFSLAKHCSNFVLWVLCMDGEIYDLLLGMNLPNVFLIKLSDVEDNELLAIKKSRSSGEYCWTITSSFMLHIFKTDLRIRSITYLDADLYFFSTPKPIFDEIGDGSILIVRHNYSKELYYQEERSGIYNVSLVCIKNDKEGRRCLEWWRRQCIKWCYSKHENGKFGDQMYLNDWPTRFKGVHVLRQKGANLAPWNLNRYIVSSYKDQVFVDEDPLIFFHFHSLKIYGYDNFSLYLNSYLISFFDEKVVYSPYVDHLNAIIKKIRNDFPKFTYGFDNRPTLEIRLKQFVKRKLLILFYLRSFLR
ncbi:glycosyl transferase [Patescibacteria group bacterium]|nr:glycosyl transferase [Patescibacteria group bacterium]